MSEPDPAFALDETPLQVDVVRGNPTPAEVAALLAVVGEAYTDEAEGVVHERPRRSQWELSARHLRAPFNRDRGWRGFSG